MRRVVITGIGMVSPVGCGVQASWSALLAGANGARRIAEFEVSDLASQVACFIPRGDKADGKFNPDDWMEPKEQRKVDDFIVYAMAAAEQALADANYKADTVEKQERAGVLIGSGIGGLPGIAETSILLKEKGPRRVSPFFIPGRLINLAGGYVSIRHQARTPSGMLRASWLWAMPTSWWQVAPSPPSAASRWQASPLAARCRRASTIDRQQPRAPTTRTAMGS
jgi:3-oxoacyl-[acyl-carrier-protein] synthase II